MMMKEKNLFSKAILQSPGFGEPLCQKDAKIIKQIAENFIESVKCLMTRGLEDIISAQQKVLKFFLHTPWSCTFYPTVGLLLSFAGEF